MIREIIAEVLPWESRAAVLEDGKLVEVFRIENKNDVGTVYKGKIQRVLPGLLCAFVDIGQERNAILYFSDVIKEATHPEVSLKKGQDVLVQMMKQASGEKGARVTEEITLPSRLLVLMPFRNEIRVSRKIMGEERQRLKAIMTKILPESMGVILRTACLTASETELNIEMELLLQKWQTIKQQAHSGKVPSIICREADEMDRVLREYLDGETREILVNEEKMHKKINEFLQTLQSKDRPKVVFKEGMLFELLGLNREVRRAVGRKVWLKSGGFLIFDQTEALMIIDVNSGKFLGKDDFEETVSQVNIEAAQEIPRQLRLRGVGGMVLIDFIDMHLGKNQKKVIDTLCEELKKDKAHTKVLGFTGLGLLEMTRKKTRRTSLEEFTAECCICGGAGRIISLATCATALKNDLLSAGYLEGMSIRCKAHPDLINEIKKDQKALTYLTQTLGKEIVWEEDRQRKWMEYLLFSQ